MLKSLELKYYSGFVMASYNHFHEKFILKIDVSSFITNLSLAGRSSTVFNYPAAFGEIYSLTFPTVIFNFFRFY